MVITAFFYFFAALLVFSGFRVVTARNPVYAVLYLILAFFNAAGIWMLLRAEFLAIVLVLVYVGAVMVLFLFIVMMLDINIDTLRRDFWKYFPVGLMIAVVIIVEAGIVLMGGFGSETLASVTSEVSARGNAADIGQKLYTDYLYPFEIAAILLLVGMIAAIALTFRPRRANNKAIEVSEQLKANKADRLKVVKLEAVNRGAEAAAEDAPDAVASGETPAAQGGEKA
ncbi:NADH-quinone oxidoreductase subunit J [Saezia sanguinis]|uniref:NADH-quinone oxidoreductase subunit J n=1 Tax=Saezia sanguinis TaxID=1965230 RepID=A0A433SH07_9BURK|nr:NADH-quinone oxidoreductase subunit J [Saezia sanguinis]RUS68039.1 NADH-quinone oxidoreductase subunit J [Saezia sanguinis]